MSKDSNTWQSVRDEVQRRIQDRVWPASALLPTEAELAEEFGCARVTVNRALRDLADKGLLDRKRKAGTRVAEFPTRKAKLDIPVIRKEIEGLGQTYGYALLARETTLPPTPVHAAMQLAPGQMVLHLRALHLGNQRPYVLEERWINLETVPMAADVDFAAISGNEWLLANARLTRGEISFGAIDLSAAAANDLGASPGESALQGERLTWDGQASVTFVQLTYAPGYRLRTGF